MILYYHFYYDLLYIACVFTTQIYKLWILDPEILAILALIITLIWFPVELARLNFAYKGNINETVSLFYHSDFEIVPRDDRIHNIHDILHPSLLSSAHYSAFPLPSRTLSLHP